MYSFHILLSADAYSTDTVLKHSSPQIHFSTTQWTMQFWSYSLPSLCCPHSLSATYNTLTRHDTTVLLLLKAGLVCHFCVSQMSQSVFCECLALCLILEGIGIPAALTPKASLIATPLGTVTIISCVLYQRTTADNHILHITGNISRFTLRKFCV